MPSFKDFYFESSTGHNKLRAHMCTPDVEPRGIIQIVHGIAEHMDRYDDFMLFLANNGYIAVGEDHLGHGKSIEREEDKGFFAESNGWTYAVQDVEILRLAMKKNHPELPIVVFGHSMGSFLTRTHLIKFPGGFDAAIISGTGNQGKPLVLGGLTVGNVVSKVKGPHYYSNFINNMAFGSYNKIYGIAKTTHDWLTRDEEVVQKYLADPLCGFIPSCSLFRDMMTGINIITNVKNLEAMNKDTPIYFMSGAMDPVGECGKGVNKAYDNFLKVGMKDVTIKLYDGGRHEMLNEINKDEVYANILAWIMSKT